jgi:hypothetical protein
MTALSSLRGAPAVVEGGLASRELRRAPRWSSRRRIRSTRARSDPRPPRTRSRKPSRAERVVTAAAAYLVLASVAPDKEVVAGPSAEKVPTRAATLKAAVLQKNGQLRTKVRLDPYERGVPREASLPDGNGPRRVPFVRHMSPPPRDKCARRPVPETR